MQEVTLAYPYHNDSDAIVTHQTLEINYDRTERSYLSGDERALWGNILPLVLYPKRYPVDTALLHQALFQDQLWNFHETYCRVFRYKQRRILAFGYVLRSRHSLQQTHTVFAYNIDTDCELFDLTYDPSEVTREDYLRRRTPYDSLLWYRFGGH